MTEFNDNGQELVQPNISIKAMLAEEGHWQFPDEFYQDMREKDNIKPENSTVTQYMP